MSVRRKPKVITTAHHRNGVGGDGFQVSIIEDPEAGRMVMIDFGADAENWNDHGFASVAVLNIEMLVAGNIAFANGNSWRGDNFAATYRPLIREVSE